MILRPSNLEALTKELCDANARGEKVTVVELYDLHRVVEHTPEDMTVTVEAGLTLATLQTQLALRRQWLPIDPPRPELLTIGALLAENASGPRRYGYGTIRDYLIGLKVVLADGRIIKSGGKVVKNVAGYDLQKLFVGGKGSLGVIVEATFKLRPLPEVEQFVQAQCESLDKATELIERICESEVTPVVLDLHNVSALHAPRSTLLTIALAFAGTSEEVEWQSAKARVLGFNEPADLNYEKSFWASEAPPRRLSVLPSRVIETIRGLGEVLFVARAGNGVIYYRGGPEPPKAEIHVELARRLKLAFDPKNIFPDLTTQ